MTWEGLNPPYRTIVADPPWRPEGWDRSGRESPKAGPSKRYSTMPVEEIRALPVEDLADEDSHLWLWAINGLLEQAFTVVRAWGFTPKNLVTWCKPGPGVGAYFRNNTEQAIFASRGRPMPPRHVPLSTWFEWPRARHSVKPAAFFDLVEQVSPSPRVELFCRQPRFGWDSWGHGYEELATVSGGGT
jgi:N6-adenosine-specific RNA methylase IME4